MTGSASNDLRIHVLVKQAAPVIEDESRGNHVSVEPNSRGNLDAGSQVAVPNPGPLSYPGSVTDDGVSSDVGTSLNLGLVANPVGPFQHRFRVNP